MKGEIVSTKQKNFNKCNIELYLSDDNRKVRYKDIPQEFDVSFLIAPYRTEYYMQINCDGYIYRTITYELPSKDNVPIDLGKIEIDKVG